MFYFFFHIARKKLNKKYKLVLRKSSPFTSGTNFMGFIRSLSMNERNKSEFKMGVPLWPQTENSATPKICWLPPPKKKQKKQKTDTISNTIKIIFLKSHKKSSKNKLLSSKAISQEPSLLHLSQCFFLLLNVSVMHNCQMEQFFKPWCYVIFQSLILMSIVLCTNLVYRVWQK